ncbi:MAG: trigger factor [Gammaproteobacteria bacterium]|jgi:trigger factor
MKVFVETTSGLGRRLTIEMPSDKIDQAIEKRIAEIAKTAKIDGFRPGKVPQRVLEQRYGNAVRQEILNDQLQSSFTDAVMQEKLKPAGRPEIKIKQFEANKPLVYEATFEVYPEIKLTDLKDVAISQFEAVVTDEDVDKAIEKIREQHAVWEEIDKTAANGDQVTIDFEGFINDKPLENGAGKEVPLVLGSGSMIPGFEDGIVGMKAGDERDIDVTFPVDYHHKASAGKKAIFKIKMHKVSKSNLPELDDEFAKKAGIKEGGFVKLREDVRTKLQEDLKAALEAKNKNAVLDKLLELNKIEIPNVLIENEKEVLHQQFMQQFPPNMQKEQMPEIDKDIFKEQAIRRVTLGLLMLEVINMYTLEPNSDRVREIIETYAQSHEDPQKIIDWYMADKERRAYFDQLNLEEQIVAKLLESAKVDKKTISLEEVSAS